MLKILGFLLKTALFASVILILGNLIRWDGKTISDQIKTQLSQAERSELAGQIKDLTSDLVADAAEGAKKLPQTLSQKNKKPASSSTEKSAEKSREPSEISTSERSKLRALIRELNGSRGQD